MTKFIALSFGLEENTVSYEIDFKLVDEEKWRDLTNEFDQFTTSLEEG
jgi:hypothetical protein